ncbi:unnamed protein product [Adineta steineri]|uniref:Uncharacterized protein n=1 Tax=Adineta steineri TaxID=433720 RepID=A0A814AJG4_9BILA|nr:unnamed protein product [Adineta steineri]CAF1480584.1 unnamed protein product [Adineta steineri]
MLRRYFSINRLCSINLCILIFVSILFYNKSINENKSLNFLNINQSSEKSVFQSRLNQRLFYFGQQFPHINISKLLHIQTTSSQTLTYFCSKYCGGWGDRIRGITSTYILAVLLQRRFVIDMQYPCNLTHFLLPNLVDWIPKYHIYEQKNYLKLDPMHKYGIELYSNISSGNLMEIWSKYENIYLTANSDYITPALKNPFFQLIKSQINIQSNESTQEILFPLIFELLFKPTSIVINQLDKLFSKSSLSYNQSIICMHIRMGQNPTVPKDAKLPFRTSIVYDMLKFIDKNLNQSYSSIFITTDSYEVQQNIYKHYGNDRMLSIPGPIVHIDRYNSKKESYERLYNGFLKVILEFYFLGECDTLLRSRSGFSEWASYRRLNKYSNLYLYCRGIHQITGPKWRRPYNIC